LGNALLGVTQGIGAGTADTTALAPAARVLREQFGLSAPPTATAADIPGTPQITEPSPANMFDEWPRAKSSEEAMDVIESRGLDLTNPAHLTIAKNYLKSQNIPASKIAELIDQYSGIGIWNELMGITPEARKRSTPGFQFIPSLFGMRETPTETTVRQRKQEAAHALSGY